MQLDQLDQLNSRVNNPQHILIINLDVKREYPILDKKLNEAVEQTLSSSQDQGIYRLSGPLNNLSLELAQYMSLNHPPFLGSSAMKIK